MRKRPLVKICGITRPEDARAATRMGADFLGAIFYPRSPRCVSEETLEELIFAMPDGKRVMVDVAPSVEEIQTRIDMGFDYCQIHFDLATTPRETVRQWADIVGPSRLWLAPRMPAGDVIPKYIFESAGTVVIDTYKAGAFGGTGQTGAWEHFVNLVRARPETRFVLAGGLAPDNLVEALEQTRAEMIDLNSGVESAPGIKDCAKLSAAMQAVKVYAES